MNRYCRLSAIALVMLFPLLSAIAGEAADPTTVFIGTTPLMHIVVGTQGMSAAQRATFIQHNLDSALINAPGTAPVVKVELFGQTPVLVLNGHYIASADADTARALNTSAIDLARKWAHDLRAAMEKQIALQDISYQTNSLPAVLPPRGPAQAAEPPLPAQALTTGGAHQQSPLSFARMPEGLILPVGLETDVHTHTMRPGDQVVADTLMDVTLPGGQILPAGTHMFADIEPCNSDSLFGIGTLRLGYKRMQLTDGTIIPISASVLMNGRAVSEFILPPGTDMAYPAGTRFILQLNQPAQVAVTGTTL